MQIAAPKRVDFPNLPFIYNRNGGSSHRKNMKYQSDGVNHFFENLIGHVNAKRPHESSLPVLSKRKENEPEVYDPTAPLITSDIYVSKPPKFKSSVQTDVERVKEHLARISGLYKEVIVYKKPKIMPLIPLPEFRHQKKQKKAIIDGEEQDIDQISDDELLPWDFGGGQGYKSKLKDQRRASKKSNKTAKSNPKAKLKPIKPKVKAPSKGLDLTNAWKEFRNVMTYIKFCDWLFRYYRYQIKSCYEPTRDYLKAHYPPCMEEIVRNSLPLVKSQLVRVWLSIFNDPTINIVINRHLLLAYGLMSEEDARVPMSKSERDSLIESYQPYADGLHVDYGD